MSKVRTQSSTENDTTKTTWHHLLPNDTSVLPTQQYAIKVILKQRGDVLQTFIKCKFMCLFFNILILGLQHLRDYRDYLLADVYFFSRFLLSSWNSCSGKLKIEKTSSAPSSDRNVYTFLGSGSSHTALKSASTSGTLDDTFSSMHLFKESHNEIKQHFHGEHVAPENTGKP